MERRGSHRRLGSPGSSGNLGCTRVPGHREVRKAYERSEGPEGRKDSAIRGEGPGSEDRGTRRGGEVSLAQWSCVVPTSRPRYARPRPSLFPADGSRREIFETTHFSSRFCEDAEGKKRRGKEGSDARYGRASLPHNFSRNQRRKSRKRRQTSTTKILRKNLEHEVLSSLAKALVQQHPELHSATSTGALNLLSEMRKLQSTVGGRGCDGSAEAPESLLDEKMANVRTHGKYFRSYVEHEAQWLDFWGAKEVGANAHCVRAIAQHDRLRAKWVEEARQQRRAKKLKKRRRARRSSQVPGCFFPTSAVSKSHRIGSW